MKNIWLILFVVLFSCNNSNDEKSLKYSEMEDFAVENTVSAENSLKKPNYNQLSIIEEKLQETYDLIYLQEKNSAFESTKKVSSIIIPNTILDSLHDSVTVNNLIQLGNIEYISDTVTHINFSYKLKFKNSEKTDTLQAILKKQDITVEGQSTTSIKIDFSRSDY